MNLGIAGKTALVVGSTSGLGLAIAQALAAEGAHVAVCGRRGDEARRRAAAMPGAMGFEIDLSDQGSALELTSTVTDALGPVELLVLNSGGPPPSDASSLTIATLRKSLETLLVRQIELASNVLPAMTAQGWGRIVGVGSSGVQQPIPGLTLSNIARAGLAGYLKSLAAEVACYGVTVNMVLPGRIDTDRVASLDRVKAERDRVDVEDVRSRSRAAIPAGRYGTSEEFAAVVTFLCSDRASYVTGEQVRCDGGLVAAY